MAQKSAAKRKPVSHETTDPLLKEAQDQTKALMTLQVYKRLAYSAVAIGTILILWGFFAGGGRAAGIAGIVVLVLGIPSSYILHIGIKHGQQNVRNMLDDYEIMHGKKPSTREEIDEQIMGPTPKPIQHVIDAANNRARKKARSR